jgi:hypothetical protein
LAFAACRDPRSGPAPGDGSGVARGASGETARWPVLATGVWSMVVLGVHSAGQEAAAPETRKSAKRHQDVMSTMTSTLVKANA